MARITKAVDGQFTVTTNGNFVGNVEAAKIRWPVDSSLLAVSWGATATGDGVTAAGNIPNGQLFLVSYRDIAALQAADVGDSADALNSLQFYLPGVTNVTAYLGRKNTGEILIATSPVADIDKFTVSRFLQDEISYVDISEAFASYLSGQKSGQYMFVVQT